MVCNKIRALVMDVDGTLTDGSIYISDSGEAIKRFNVKDGYGICNMLPEMNIVPIIITGRTSQILLNRCKELGVKNVIQGSKNKMEDMLKILEQEKISLCQTAYIGDDINDYECMKRVGLRGCPNDAVNSIKELSECITESTGGNGAVREFIEWINKKSSE